MSEEELRKQINKINIKLATIITELGNLKELEKTHVTKIEFEPVKNMVNKAVWLIVSGFIGAVISFIMLNK